MKHLATSLLASIGLLSSGFCQAGGESTVLSTLDGTGEDQYGARLAPAGDIDGDGVLDFLNLGFLHDGIPLEDLQYGRVWVISGADNSTILELDGLNVRDWVGVSGDGGKDFTGDGVPDLAIHVRENDNEGIVRLYSGANGAIMRTFEGAKGADYFGSAVLLLDDLDGDGMADLAASAPGADTFGNDSRGEVSVYSSADGSLLYSFQGNVNNDSLGSDLASAGDFDGDGHEDFLVGSSLKYHFGYAAGAVDLHSGATGTRIMRITGTPGDRMGNSVSMLDDVDGDGIADILAGCSGWEGHGQYNNGKARVLSGADGSILREHIGAENSLYYGRQVLTTADIDADGIRDYLISAAHTNNDNGFVDLYSGASGIILHRFRPPTPTADPYSLFGSMMLAMDDTDGDGRQEFLFGDPGIDEYNYPEEPGEIHRMQYDPFLDADSDEVSAAVGGDVQFVMDFPDGAAGLDYKMLVSAVGTGPVTYGVPIPLNPDPMVIDSYSGTYAFPTTAMHGVLDGSGDATATANFPVIPPQFIGRTLYFAGIAEPTGLQPNYSTAPMPVTIVP